MKNYNFIDCVLIYKRLDTPKIFQRINRDILQMEIVIMEAVVTGLHLMELPSSNICSTPYQNTDNILI
jgi:hypothetical protein